MAWTAFRSNDSRAAIRAVRKHFTDHGVRLRTLTPDPWGANWDKDVFAYERPPWLIFQWPEYSDGYDLPLATSVSRSLGCLASTNAIHCDDLWRHALIENGVVLDEFANRPTYFQDSKRSARARALLKRYRGNPDRVARAFGVKPALVKRYFVHLRMDRLSPFAFRDDACRIGDPWAFRELWRRVGIVIPKDGKHCILQFRPDEDYRDKIPSNAPAF